MLSEWLMTDRSDYLPSKEPPVRSCSQRELDTLAERTEPRSRGAGRPWRDREEGRGRLGAGGAALQEPAQAYGARPGSSGRGLGGRPSTSCRLCAWSAATRRPGLGRRRAARSGREEAAAEPRLPAPRSPPGRAAAHPPLPPLTSPRLLLSLVSPALLRPAPLPPAPRPPNPARPGPGLARSWPGRADTSPSADAAPPPGPGGFRTFPTVDRAVAALSPKAEHRAGLRRPSRPLGTPWVRERGHPGSGLRAPGAHSGAGSFLARQPPRAPAPALLDWTERSRTTPSPGNAARGLRGSLRLWLAHWDLLGVASDALRPGHLWPESPRPARPWLLPHPQPGGGWGRFFLPPFWERGGPAPSHRPDVSRGGSEDLPEARGRRVQREKPTLGSLGGPPTSSWGLAPDADRKAGRYPHPRGLPSSNPAPFPELPTSGTPSTSGRPQLPSFCKCQLPPEISAFATAQEL